MILFFLKINWSLTFTIYRNYIIFVSNSNHWEPTFCYKASYWWLFFFKFIFQKYYSLYYVALKSITVIYNIYIYSNRYIALKQKKIKMPLSVWLETIQMYVYQVLKLSQHNHYYHFFPSLPPMCDKCQSYSVYYKTSYELYPEVYPLCDK